MITSRVGTAATGGATGTQQSRIEKSRAPRSASKVTAAATRSINDNYYLQKLHERPRLISELSDSHKSFCSASIAQELLKKVVLSLIKIRKILAKGEFSPTLLNQIDIEKKAVLEAVETKVFGDFILDSSFQPVTNVGNWIEFSVPGLDFVRERLTDELLTVYINRNMLPLAFDRTINDKQLLQQFQQQAGYSHMTMRMAQDKSIVIGIRDRQWRLWDGMVFVSGQGGRYAAGQPMSFQVKAAVPTVEDVTRLDLRENTSPDALDPVIEHVNRIHLNLSQTIQGQSESAEQLFKLCQSFDTEKMESTLNLLTQVPGRAALTIYRNYNGPSRENVINLLDV